MHEPFNASEWLLDRHIGSGSQDRTAIVCQGRTLTYRQVLDEVEAAAAGLRGLGVRPEERVAMAMLDSVEFVAIFLGAMRIGAVPVPMNPLLPGRDLGVITADSRARLAVVSGARGEVIEDVRRGAPEVDQVVVTDGANGPVGDGNLAWNDLLAAGDGQSPDPYATWAESPGFWLCTSGSTGQPKLAMHRHGDLLVTHETYASQVLETTEDDRFFSVGPMFHAYGLGNSMTFPFAVGATTILEPTRPPSPQLVADLVGTHGPTLFFCIPTFYAALNASDLSDDTFASVRFGVSAAEPLPADTCNRFADRFGVTILDGIGSTEVLHIYLSNSPSRHKPGASGVPVPGYDVQVVDENGAEQPVGEPGQLVVKGGSTATGYWCRSDTTQSTFVGDWMRTGDLYEQGSDDFYTYLGRVDDMLRVGGEWVSPAEVEGALMEHATVHEAAVVGERDGDGVLRPIAYVTASAEAVVDADELTSFCRDRLAGYKRPRRYEVVEELPKTATGKIQRFKLRT